MKDWELMFYILIYGLSPKFNYTKFKIIQTKFVVFWKKNNYINDFNLKQTNISYIFSKIKEHAKI